MLTVIIECGDCAGSGQWPVVRSQESGVRSQQEPGVFPDSCLLSPDSYAIKACPFCAGQASWNLTLTGRLEREIRWLVVQQQHARQRPA